MLLAIISVNRISGWVVNLYRRLEKLCVLMKWQCETKQNGGEMGVKQVKWMTIIALLPTLICIPVSQVGKYAMQCILTRHWELHNIVPEVIAVHLCRFKHSISQVTRFSFQVFCYSMPGKCGTTSQINYYQMNQIQGRQGRFSLTVPNNIWILWD